MFFCQCVTFEHTAHILAKINNVKTTLVDFDICHRMVSLQKLLSMALTYFCKFNNLKRQYL